MARNFQILVLNQISQAGLKRLPADSTPSARTLLRPTPSWCARPTCTMDIPASVRAIGRAGAGTNNIPVKAMSGRGVPVFNAPGANANAVKELVIAGMLLAARNISGAMRFVSTLDPQDPEMDKKVEDGKKNFAGYELAGHTLGVIGLGKIGCLVADAAIKLGMNVMGYDPEITVDAAWSLPSQVRKAHSVAEVLKNSNFVSLHVPLGSRHEKDGERPARSSTSCAWRVLLNFSREGVVDVAAVLAALEAKKLACYVCDFPSPHVNGHPQVVALPHLGASTREAEDNCAAMVADQVRDYLEHGNVRNAVNFPNVVMPRESNFRMAIANANVPNMVGQISTAMAKANLNIHNMLNKSRGEMAYTLVDVDSAVPQAAIDSIAGIEGVLAVRYLPA
jgi:D-3-phosphoglycerate dehydrogenase